jgi:ribonuclease-3
MTVKNRRCTVAVDSPHLFDALEARLNYRFVERSRLGMALTHRSYANELPDAMDNERFEFLGDAVLSLAVSHYLLRVRPDADEGILTQLRSELVNEARLAEVARSLQLGEHLLLGRGEARSGGKDKASLLADSLEALFGAVFLDGGYACAAMVIERLLGPYLDSAANQAEGDHKTRLQELLQGRRAPRPHYRLALASGPDHQRHYEVEVLVADQILGRGTGGSKKRAEQAAAGQALQNLERFIDE